MALRVTTSIAVLFLVIESVSKTSRQCEHGCGSFFRCPDSGASHYNSVRKVSNRPRLRGSRDTESNTDWKRGRRSQPQNGFGQRGGHFGLQSSHSETADKIDEAASMARDLGHAIARSRWCDEADERERPVAKPLFSFRISAHGNVRDENPTRSGVSCPGESACPGGNDRVQITEQDQGHFELRLVN